MLSSSPVSLAGRRDSSAKLLNAAGDIRSCHSRQQHDLPKYRVPHRWKLIYVLNWYELFYFLALYRRLVNVLFPRRENLSLVIARSLA